MMPAVLALLVLASCQEAPLTPSTEPEPVIVVAGAIGYEAIDLGTLNGAATSMPAALHDDGRVVGESSGRPFVWQNGVMTELPGGISGQASAIGPTGLIAGSLITDPVDSHRRVAVWEAGVVRELGPLQSPTFIRIVGVNARNDVLAEVRADHPQAQGLFWNGSVLAEEGIGHLAASQETYPRAMNASGDVVATSFVLEGGPAIRHFHAVRWSSGVLLDLGTLGSYPCPDAATDTCHHSEAWDINGVGVVVGTSNVSADLTRAFIWQAGTMQELGLFPGEPTRAFFVNDRGDIAGTVSIGAGERVWRQLKNGGVRELGSLGGGGTRMTDMNEDGWIVGSSMTAEGQRRAFVFRGDTIVNLELGPSGGDASEAIGINEQGDVIGWSGGVFPDEPRRAVLWRRKAP